MNPLHKFLHKLGVALAYILMIGLGPSEAGSLGYAKQASPGIFVSMAICCFLVRKQIMDRTFSLLQKGTEVKVARRRAYLSTVLNWLWMLVVFTLIGSAQGTEGAAGGFVIALFSWVLAALFGLGAASREVNRVSNLRELRSPITEREPWGWAVFSFVALFLIGLGTYQYYKVRQRIEQHQELNSVTATFKQQRQANAKRIEEQLDRGTYSAEEEVKQSAKNAAAKEKLVAGMKDSVFKSAANAALRVQKTVGAQANAVNAAFVALSTAGGVFDPEIRTKEQVLNRRKLVNDVENVNLVYRARIANLRALALKELEFEGITGAASESFVADLVAKMQVDSLLALAEQNDQGASLCHAVLDLLDRTLDTRTVDKSGRAIFAQGADVETYNSLLERAEKLEQAKESIVRRIAAKVQSEK